jgi:transposase-like protein
MTSPNSKEGEVLVAERRRRWSGAEKLAMVRETYEPGITVSLVARKCGINPNQLFHWRKLERVGALTTVELTAVEAGESVVPAAELEAARLHHSGLLSFSANEENMMLKLMLILSSALMLVSTECSK